MPRLAPFLLRAIARGARVLTFEHHLPSRNEAEVIEALPADCKPLVHMLTPVETHLFGQMRLHSAAPLCPINRDAGRRSEGASSRPNIWMACVDRLRPCLQCNKAASRQGGRVMRVHSRSEYTYLPMSIRTRKCTYHVPVRLYSQDRIHVSSEFRLCIRAHKPQQSSVLAEV